ncbi:MAG: hypothetical protein QOJ27_2298 [Sphingomonadales bacterium]|nr:hypothetical protein [Sphingomonadales bacterium]
MGRLLQKKKVLAGSGAAFASPLPRRVSAASPFSLSAVPTTLVQRKSVDEGDPLKAAPTYKTTAVEPQVGEALPTPTPTSAPGLMSVPTYGSSLPRADEIVAGRDDCGSAGSEWVPDAPFGFDFSEVCVKHDACYDKQLGQEFCDYRLLVDAFAECRKYRMEGECQKVATIYYASLRATGHIAYKNAAKKSGKK